MQSPRDELAGLRRLVAALKSKSLTIYENRQDVTVREVWKLENDIKFLESILKRMRAAS
jgi:hypothetical protein